MIKVLLCVVGVLVAVGGVAAVWFGFERIQDAERLGQDINVEKSQIARPGTPEARKESGEQKIAGWEREIEGKGTESYVWFGGAAVAFVAGVCMALVPWLGKRKRPVAKPAPEPAKSADAAGDGGGH